MGGERLSKTLPQGGCSPETPFADLLGQTLAPLPSPLSLPGPPTPWHHSPAPSWPMLGAAEMGSRQGGKAPCGNSHYEKAGCVSL